MVDRQSKSQAKIKRRSYELGYARLKRLWCSGNYPGLTVRRARLFVRQWPRDAASWLILGTALVQMARYQEAREAINKAIELCAKEGRSIPLAQMGHLFEQSGDYVQSATWFQKAIEAKPEDATYHIFLGSILAKQGKLKEAEESHRAAVMCSEGAIDEAFLNLGFVLRAQERFEEAAECFREAIRLDPDYKIANLALRDVKLCVENKKGDGKE